MIEIESVNESQREAIITTEGPVMIIAGPGTGKTFTLVKRIAHLIVDLGVKPDEIMVVTFTEKAARELLTRVSDELSKYMESINVNEMYIGTFHAVCVRLLSENSIHIEGYQDRKVIDSFEQMYLVQKNIGSFNLLKGYSDFIDVKMTVWRQAEKICSLINHFMEELVDINKLRYDESPYSIFVSKVISRYNEMIERNNVLDFSSIQVSAYKNIIKNREVLKKIQEQIKYVMVDEYQDTNYIQEQLMLKIAELRNNICVVGDDDQGMYRFRGATIRNILEFPEKIGTDKCKTIMLNNNYRSESGIINLYNNWMSDNYVEKYFDWGKYRYRKNIVPVKVQLLEKNSVFSCIGNDTCDQATRIISTINNLMNNGNITDYNQVAFLFRSVKNTHVLELQKILEENGIPVYSPRSDMFFEREEIQAIIGCIMQCFSDYLRDLKANSFTVPISDTMRNYYIDCLKLSLNYSKANSDLSSVIAEIRTFVDGLVGESEINLLSIFYRVVSVRPFCNYLEVDARDNSLVTRKTRNLAEFSRMLTRFSSLHKYHGITLNNKISMTRDLFNQYLRLLFVDGIGEYEDLSEYAPSGCVSFMTIHQAKGLEFPVVFAGSLNSKPRHEYNLFMDDVDRRVCNRSPYEPSEDIKYYDFWRLFYTSFSRAQNLLILTNYNKNTGMFAKLLDSVDDVSNMDIGNIRLQNTKLLNYKKTYSFTSHISVYDDCPKQYKMYKEFGFSHNSMRHTSVGTLIHETLERINKYVISHGLEGLDESIINEWFLENVKNLSAKTGYSFDENEVRSLSTQVLHYYDKRLPVLTTAWKAEEEVKLIGDDYILQGIVDLIEDYGDHLEIVDYKTGSKPDYRRFPEKISHYRHQMQIYAYLIEMGYHKPVSCMRLYYTKEFEDPEIKIEFIREDIEKTIKEINETVRKIEIKDFEHDVTNSYTCRYCDFRDYCKKGDEV